MIAGVARSVGRGTPRLPRKLVPQHATSPLVHSAQLCDQPAETAATPSRQAASSPGTGTGGETRGDAAGASGLPDGVAPQPVITTGTAAGTTISASKLRLMSSIELR